MSGKSILHSIMTHEDLVKVYNKNGAYHRFLMKFNLKKAYDSIIWGFI